MISTRKLIQMAKRWQRMAAAKRRRLSWPKTVASKGHFVVYTTDKKRFMIPLSYLKSKIVSELLVMAEEEFGVTSDGPITLPCDSIFMEYAILILQRHVTQNVERALVVSLNACRSSSSAYQQPDLINQQFSISSF